MATGSGHGRAPEFRDAFLEASAKLMPRVVWCELSNCELEYPDPSPVLGPLGITFESDQITAYFGRHHRHFMLYEGDALEGPGKIAAQALGFIQELVNDRVVVRWGAWGSRTFPARRSHGILRRLWRLTTPWVREAVWSGRTVA